MTYNVGDRVSYKGDKGTVTAVLDNRGFYFNIAVAFDEGGSAVFSAHELEAAE